MKDIQETIYYQRAGENTLISWNKYTPNPKSFEILMSSIFNDVYQFLVQWAIFVKQKLIQFEFHVK